MLTFSQAVEKGLKLAEAGKSPRAAAYKVLAEDGELHPPKGLLEPLADAIDKRMGSPGDVSMESTQISGRNVEISLD